MRKCEIAPHYQPYSKPLREISELISDYPDDAEATRLITDYLEQSGVPVHERRLRTTVLRF